MKRRIPIPPASLAEQVALLESSVAHHDRAMRAVQDMSAHWCKLYVDAKIEAIREINPELYALMNMVVE